jgi:signal transduction histidine kinase
VGIQVTARDVTEQSRTQTELLRTSHLAGMTEVATGVLHNVGNVLNSVNVSTSVLSERMRKSKIHDLRRAATMMKDHATDLTGFLTDDPRGKRLPSYFFNVAEHLADEQSKMLLEMDSLSKNVTHIKDIVAMQQSYAKVVGMIEKLSPVTLVEDALQICISDLTNHHIEIIREFKEAPIVNVDKHKVLQILVNLIANARYAILENSASPDNRLFLSIDRYAPDRIRITVKDTGIGIAPENLTKIFGFGFTTKKDGHGFGLHLGAIAARQMGGSLTADSDGIGKGASFTLELPVTQS